MFVNKTFNELEVLLKIGNHNKRILLPIEKNLPVNMRNIHKNGSKQLLNLQKPNHPQIVKTLLEVLHQPLNIDHMALVDRLVGLGVVGGEHEFDFLL